MFGWETRARESIGKKGRAAARCKETKWKGLAIKGSVWKRELLWRLSRNRFWVIVWVFRP